MIYFDNSATSYPKPGSVYRAVTDTMIRAGGNAGRGGHRLSNAAENRIYKARESTATLFGVKNPAEICFVSGATAGLNYAVKGVLMKRGGSVIISDVEHNSVLRPVHKMTEYGFSYSVLPCDDIVNNMTVGTALVVVNHMSNVTGELADIKSIGKGVRENGGIFVVDASQSAGHIDIDVVRDNVDILVTAGHKGLFGPQGSGILYVRGGIEAGTLIEGGTGSMSELLTQPEFFPDRFEAGTLNAPGIAGLGAGIEFVLKKGIENIRSKEKMLAGMLCDGLKAIKGVSLYSTGSTGVVSFNLDRYDSVELANMLSDKYDIMVRGGIHCSCLAHKKNGTLEKGSVRVSLSCFNTKRQVLKFLNSIDRMV